MFFKGLCVLYLLLYLTKQHIDLVSLFSLFGFDMYLCDMYLSWRTSYG